MNLDQVMKQKNFVVIGNTINEEKYAYKIKHALLKHDYNVQAVGKELTSINDVEGEIDIIDLCINSKEGLRLLQECKKPFKSIVIQPGAEGPELIEYLESNKIPYINGCLLVGITLYVNPDFTH